MPPGLLCRLNLHRPDMCFRWAHGHRVVHCTGCGREMIAQGRGRWRPSTPGDRFRH